MSHAMSPVRATDAAIRTYHAAVASFAPHNAEHEGATETAFSRSLTDTGKPRGWTLIPKKGIKAGGKQIIPDDTLWDVYKVPRG